MTEQKNIPLFKVFMSEDVLKPTNDILMSGSITQGVQVEKFEDELKNYFKIPYILTLNSATAGLTLALRLLKNKDIELNWNGFDEKDDIVLTPALTCFATTASVLINNVNIRWIDIDPNTVNIDLNDLKNKLSEKTKIIYIVHWGGYPVDLDKLKELQEYSLEKFGFKPMIVEDCAHAFGATYKGKKLGNHGNICVFSLQAIKHLTTGDGGIIILPTQKLYDRCKLLRWYGINRDKRNYKGKDFRLENDIEEYGYKFHMNDINATIGLHNLPHITSNIQCHRDNASYYFNELKDIDGISLLENANDREGSWWLFTFLVNNKNSFIENMKKKGIMTSQVHQRNDTHSCVKKYLEKLNNLDRFENNIICIPVGWWITKDDRQYIVKCIKESL